MWNLKKIRETKKDNDERENIYDKNLVLECDYKAKEERGKCEKEHKNNNIFLEEMCV